MSEIDDDKGVSVMLMNTENEKETNRKITAISCKVTFNDMVAANPVLIRSVIFNKYRNIFCQKSMNTIDMQLDSLTSVSFYQRCQNKLLSTILR